MGNSFSCWGNLETFIPRRRHSSTRSPPKMTPCSQKKGKLLEQVTELELLIDSNKWRMSSVQNRQVPAPVAMRLHKDISPSTNMSFRGGPLSLQTCPANCFSAIRLFVAVHTSGRGCEIKEKSIREKVSWALQALSQQDCLPGTQLCSSWSIPLYVC